MRAGWVWGGILVGSVLLMGSAMAVHLPWMEGLTSADGTSCCREVDCVPADVHLRSSQGDLLVNGQPVRLPLGSIHLMPPEETHGWWCHRSEPGCPPRPSRSASAAGAVPSSPASRARVKARAASLVGVYDGRYPHGM
jgi:hypothetical protein